MAGGSRAGQQWFSKVRNGYTEKVRQSVLRAEKAILDGSRARMAAVQIEGVAAKAGADWKEDSLIYFHGQESQATEDHASRSCLPVRAAGEWLMLRIRLRVQWCQYARAWPRHNAAALGACTVQFHIHISSTRPMVRLDPLNRAPSSVCTCSKLCKDDILSHV